MLVDASHRAGVEGLHQKRHHTGDHDGVPAVYLPDDTVGAEVSLVVTIAHRQHPVGFPAGVAGEHGEKRLTEVVFHGPAWMWWG